MSGVSVRASWLFAPQLKIVKCIPRQRQLAMLVGNSFSASLVLTTLLLAVGIGSSRLLSAR